MLDDYDPNPPPSCTADLSFAIASARAVVRALIAQDQDAAEEAALRTCRDCELLVRLIRDLAAVLQTNDLNQLTCSQAELVWLAGAPSTWWRLWVHQHGRTNHHASLLHKRAPEGGPSSGRKTWPGRECRIAWLRTLLPLVSPSPQPACGFGSFLSMRKMWLPLHTGMGRATSLSPMGKRIPNPSNAEGQAQCPWLDQAMWQRHDGASSRRASIC
jgi:hypothetical protein